MLSRLDVLVQFGPGAAACVELLELGLVFGARTLCALGCSPRREVQSAPDAGALYPCWVGFQHGVLLGTERHCQKPVLVTSQSAAVLAAVMFAHAQIQPLRLASS